MGLQFPVTIGRDFAGEVEAIAPCTETSLQVGDRVVGYLPVGKGRGTFAERCVAPASCIVKLPGDIAFTAAAGLPTAGCTTYQALVGRCVLKKGAGQKILILGGSTGNGVFAIQLAKAYGCAAIATTSSAVELCTSLGATTVVNHRKGEKWEEVLQGQDFDIIYDCIEGLSAWGKAPAVLKRSGAQFISIVTDDSQADASVGGILLFLARMAWRSMWSVFGYPSFTWHLNPGSTEGLAELVDMLTDGKLRVPLDGPLRPPTLAGFAGMWDVQMSGRAHGKLVMDWSAKA